MGRGITVYTDDPARPKVFLVLRAIVLTSVGFLPSEPPRLTNRNPLGVSSSLLVRKDLTESGTLQIENLRTSVPWLRAEAVRIPEARPGGEGRPTAAAGDWQVDISLGANPAYGTIEAEVKFETGLPREPTVTIPVTLHLAPPVNLPIERLVVPDGDGEIDSAAFVFSVRRGLDPGQLQVVGSSPELDVAVERSGRRGFKGQVRWSGEAREGTLQFRTDDEVYELPVVRATDGD